MAKPKCFGKKATLVVRGGKARGSQGPDVIVVRGKAGAKVNARGGNDLICGGPGPDVLKGGPGHDRIKGGSGEDRLVAGPGRDRLRGGPGVDRFFTGRGGARIADAQPGEFINGRQLPSTRRVNVGAGGVQADLLSERPAISGNGRYVAFVSRARNLIPGQEEPPGDIDDDVFVYDRKTGKLECVSVDASGFPVGGTTPSLSDNGRYVVFASSPPDLVAGDDNDRTDVFLRDLGTGTTELVSMNSDGEQGNHVSVGPQISGDGRYVVFNSLADNLAEEDDTNGRHDVFVRDLQEGTTRRVSVGIGGEPDGASDSATISDDGRFVAFASAASNLVEDDTNGAQDIFVRDLRGSSGPQLVSVSSDGEQANALSGSPVISDDGGRVVFQSTADNLVPNDGNGAQDIFVRDLVAGTTRRASVSSSGVEASEGSFQPSISGNGRFVSFYSAAANLVVGDTNGSGDVFVRDLRTGGIERVSLTSAGGQANGWSYSSSWALSDNATSPSPPTRRTSFEAIRTSRRTSSCAIAAAEAALRGRRPGQAMRSRGPWLGGCVPSHVRARKPRHLRLVPCAAGPDDRRGSQVLRHEVKGVPLAQIRRHPARPALYAAAQ